MTDFRIADTFVDSLARLTRDEQKAVKTNAFDLQLNPANPGHQFHKLDKAKDKNFWSIRVNADIRLIVHRTPGSLLLCYVDHHDKAYAWAERRKLEAHPQTGAAQLVELVERTQEIVIPRYVDAPVQQPISKPLFAATPTEELLGYGVPNDWLDQVRSATEESLLDLATHLPQEAGEALLELATGGTVQFTQWTPANINPFEHPDAQRRFRVVNDVEELARALDFPWDKWTIFLHPSQREAVERNYGGPARVSGSAGTGKTIVALHRAVFLARNNPNARVLLTTFSETLAESLRARLRRLIGESPRLAERLEVHSLPSVARRLFERNVGRASFATEQDIRQILREAAKGINSQSSERFIEAEWASVVDAWQLNSWESYRDVVRLGRRTRLPENKRKALWAIFENAIKALEKRELLTENRMLAKLARQLNESKHSPYDFIVIDEAQDVSVAQLRFLAVLGRTQPGGLFFTGDLGQRIFQQPFSWKSHGVDIRGRSTTLRVNYRTSHQIREQADRLLGMTIADVDGNIEERDAVSVFNGIPPKIQLFESAAEESAAVAKWIKERISDGVHPHEIGIFVRSIAEVERAMRAVDDAGLKARVLDDAVATTEAYCSIATMHLAKGLEFRAVAVMACDDEIVPLQSRLASVSDDSDLEEAYNTERYLLYVACTRARDFLFVSGRTPASEFLRDLVTAQ